MHAAFAEQRRAALALAYGEIADELRVPYEEELITEVLKDASLKSDRYPNAGVYRVIAERIAERLKKGAAL